MHSTSRCGRECAPVSQVTCAESAAEIAPAPHPAATLASRMAAGCTTALHTCLRTAIARQTRTGAPPRLALPALSTARIFLPVHNPLPFRMAATGAGAAPPPTGLLKPHHKFGDTAVPCKIKVDLETGWWDKDAFTQSHPVLQLRLPVKAVGPAKAALGSALLKHKFVPNVLADEAGPEAPTRGGYVPAPPSAAQAEPAPASGKGASPFRWLLLDPALGTATDLSSLPDAARKELEALGLAGVRAGSFTTTWRHMRHSEAVNAILPSGMEALHSFERIGHVAHMNMHREHLPYKQLIAQLVMDYYPGTVRTLVNKTGTIDTVFRTFGMEVLRGEPSLRVTIKENGINFTFDFDKVYWNSRLQPEHARMINWIGGWDAPGVSAAKTAYAKAHRRTMVDGIRAQHRAAVQAAGGVATPQLKAALKAALADAPRGKISIPHSALLPVADEALAPLTGPAAVVADMFCGIGPFALPLAQRGTLVHANDLNPESVASLRIAAEANKVDPALCRPYNMDGRAFIRSLLADGVRFDHVLMNLPADALAFCDAFVGSFPAANWRAASPAELCRVNRLGGLYSAALPDVTPAQIEAAATQPSPPPATATTTAPAGDKWPLPRVHCYCFSKRDSEAEAAADVMQRLAAIMGRPLGEDEGLRIRSVRDVAPSKLMMLVSFTLPADAALAPTETSHSAKRARVE